MTRGRLLHWAGGLAALFGAANFARAIQNALSFNRGDFYYSLPGEYASRVNPTLWNAPDIQLAIAYNKSAYFYGPAQYLTLYPIVFADSYEGIARILLVTHALALVAAFVLLWKALTWNEPRTAGVAGLLFGAMFMFRPSMQAYVQREFEIVALLLLAAGTYLLVRGREGWGSAVFGYLAWFKYWPIIYFGYFATALRWRAMAVYAATSAAVLAVTHLVFGLKNFAIANTLFIITMMFVPLGKGDVLLSPTPGAPYKEAFCRQWVPGRGTQVSMRWGLCGIEDRFPMFPARLVFYSLVLLLGAVIVFAGLRMATRTLEIGERKWATIWQVSLLTIVGATLLHGHYYYMTMVTLPVLALLYRYARDLETHRWRLALWAVMYAILTAFLLPLPLLSRLVQRDAWALYMDSTLYVAGELLLIALVIRETAGLHLRGQYAHRA